MHSLNGWDMDYKVYVGEDTVRFSLFLGNCTIHTTVTVSKNSNSSVGVWGQAPIAAQKADVGRGIAIMSYSSNFQPSAMCSITVTWSTSSSHD